MVIKRALGPTALDTADNVRATIDNLRTTFPPGLEAVYPYDTTPFVRLSIEEVIKTLFEAIVLVFLVMYLFLQNLRATFIPTIAVPVVLLGTFAVLSVRSEEHTSELQSLMRISYAVFCLKKKNKQKQYI